MSQVPFMPPSCEWEPPDGKLQHLGVLKLSKPRQFKPHIPDHLPHSLPDDLCHGSEVFHHPPGCGPAPLCSNSPCSQSISSTSIQSDAPSFGPREVPRIHPCPLLPCLLIPSFLAHCLGNPRPCLQAYLLSSWPSLRGPAALEGQIFLRLGLPGLRAFAHAVTPLSTSLSHLLS